MSVSGMWWGSAPLDQTGTLAINRLVQAAAKQAARPQAANLSNPCKVHVGGVPSEAREDTLFAHFAALEPQTVSVSGWAMPAGCPLVVAAIAVGVAHWNHAHARWFASPSPIPRSSRPARASRSSRLRLQSLRFGPFVRRRRCRSWATRCRWSSPRLGRGDRLNLCVCHLSWRRSSNRHSPRSPPETWTQSLCLSAPPAGWSRATTCRWPLLS